MPDIPSGGNSNPGIDNTVFTSSVSDYNNLSGSLQDLLLKSTKNDTQSLMHSGNTDYLKGADESIT
ncbi:MAG: hypothetical protein WC860_04885 [Candidatus Margulisiibacteriota bacterium]|jgi:hypothetical protein